ncbi:hypothetical protein ACOMHN_036614 [Nucella lapillus]
MPTSAFLVMASLLILDWFSASVKGQGSQPPTYPYVQDSAILPQDPHHTPYPNHPYPHPDPNSPYPPPPSYYVQVNPSPAHLYPYNPSPNYQTHFLPVHSSSYPNPNLAPNNNDNYYYNNYYDPNPGPHPYYYHYDPNSYLVPYSGPGYPRYEYATVGSSTPSPPPPSSPQSPPTLGTATGGSGGGGEEAGEVDEGGAGMGGGGPVFNRQLLSGAVEGQPAWPYGKVSGVTSGGGSSANGRLYPFPPAMGGQGLLETVARAQRHSRPSASASGSRNNFASNPLFLMMVLDGLS